MSVMRKFFNTRLMTSPRTAWLAAEAFLLLAVIPLMILELRDRSVMIGVLWVGGLGCWLYLRRRAERAARMNWDALRAALKPILIRFALLAPAITAAAWLFMPAQFLSFPLYAPERWLMVMLLYPLLSVWPQEVIYRAFLHARYTPLWGQGKGFIAASTLAFGYMHIIFLNWQAVIMTILLGFILARDYARHHSLALVCLEHALYGCLIFTVGLGTYFYSGAAWR
jgi:hypothetical protein